MIIKNELFLSLNVLTPSATIFKASISNPESVSSKIDSFGAPKLSILDETDSGLDIDALKIVADGVNTLRDKNNSFLIITHYQRLLDYIKPDFVHVLMNGKIVKSGGPDLALELEKKGYENFN